MTPQRGHSDLEQYLSKHGPLPVEEVASLGVSAAAALLAAHRGGIIHRHLTAGQILLDADGGVRLGDPSLVSPGRPEAAVAGSAPPEVLAGEPSQVRSNLYALGAILFRALTAAVPSGTEALGHRPSKLRPDVPGWLDNAIAGATAALPGDRFPSAAAMLDALTARGAGAESRPVVRRTGGRLDFCFVCGADDPLGAGLCPDCVAAHPEETALLLIERTRTFGEREQQRTTLRAMLEAHPGHGGLEGVLRGERPLARVPRVAALRIRARLARHDLATRVVTDRWVALPGSAYGVAVLVTATGVAAGLLAAPVLLWVSPMLAALLILEGQRRGQDPVLRGGGRPSLFGTRVARKLAVTVARLPEGTSLGLLADLVRLAQPLGRQHQRDGAPRSALDVDQLVSRACDAASDLAALEVRFGNPENPGASAEALGARDGLVKLMLETITVLRVAVAATRHGPALERTSGAVRAALVREAGVRGGALAAGEGALPAR